MNLWRKLYNRVVELRRTPVVDDDFPEKLHLVDSVVGAISRHKPMPTIVCLCGSTRYRVAFEEANYQLTMQGYIVLSVGFFMHACNNVHGGNVGATPEQKIELDELHKRKIDLADEVLVLNVDGYIGESTRSEINYAKEHGKPVRYLHD